MIRKKVFERWKNYLNSVGLKTQITNKIRILEFLKTNKTKAFTTLDLEKKLRIKRTTILYHLKKLVKNNLIEYKSPFWIYMEEKT